MAAKEYDVLIVGSGHSGGMAANILTKQGVNCLMLNAGPEADFEHNRVTKAVYELPYRGFGQPGRLPHVYQANEFNANQWVDENENPVHARSREACTTGCASAWWAADRCSGRVSHSASAISNSRPATSKAPARTGPSAWPTSTRSIRAWKPSSASPAARKAGREFPDGNFVEPQLRSGQRDHQATSPSSAKQRGMKFSKMRSSGGQNGLASSVNLLLPDAHGDRQAGHGLERHRARDHHRQEHRPRQRRAFRRSPLAARNVTSRRAWWCWRRERWKARDCC